MADLRDGETRDDTAHAARGLAQTEIAAGERCPECTAPYAREGGCRRCPDCGHSPDCNGGERA